MTEWEASLVEALVLHWREEDLTPFSTITKAREAYEDYKYHSLDWVELVASSLSLRKQAPRSVINSIAGGGWVDKNPHDKDKILWELGWDTKLFDFAEAIGWYTYQGERKAGVYILGQERSDEEWVNKWVGSTRVASMEAQLAFKQDSSLYREISKLEGKR